MLKYCLIAIFSTGIFLPGTKKENVQKASSGIEFNVNGKKFDYVKTETHYAKIPTHDYFTVGLTFESASGSTLDLFIPEMEKEIKLPKIVDLGSKSRGDFGMAWKSRDPYEALYTPLSGKITISKWDHKKRIISGTFSAKLKTDDPDKPKEITGGKFENVKY